MQFQKHKIKDALSLLFRLYREPKNLKGQSHFDLILDKCKLLFNSQNYKETSTRQ